MATAVYLYSSCVKSQPRVSSIFGQITIKIPPKMGRKNQVKHQKQEHKSKHSLNLSSSQRKLQQLIDKILRLTTTPAEETLAKNLELHKELMQVVEQVQLLEKEIESKSSIDDRLCVANLNRFTSWMKENGAKFEGAEIAEFSGYELGLKAKIDIKESSLVIAVPRDLMLTIEAAYSSALGALIDKDPLLSNMPNVSLTIFLLLEKFVGNSFWKPYIDILPTSYSTVLYYTMDELKELQASPTLDSALKQIKNIARQYAYFYKLVWTSDDPASAIFRKYFTFNEYR